MSKNKWGAEPWVNAPKVEEIEESNEIAASLCESLADPGECIVPPPRLSMVDAEVEMKNSDYNPKVVELHYEPRNAVDVCFDPPKLQDPLVDDGWGSKKAISAEFYTHKSRVEDLISQVSIELNIAHTKKYDAVQAELTAALILEAQKELSEFLADAELISKEKKAEVERIEAEQYFFYKKAQTERITDVALGKMIAKDKLVLSAKKEQYQAESDFSKYKNLFAMLKDGHVFFRGLAKGKNDWT